MMIKILLVDDQIAVREGLRMRLSMEADLCVVGEATNGVAALRAAQMLMPDVVVMDVEMPHMDGITATQALRAALPQTAVVMLSIHGDTETRSRAQAAGAAAFVEKQGADQVLFTAIRSAARGVVR